MQVLVLEVMQGRTSVGPLDRLLLVHLEGGMLVVAGDRLLGRLK